jgi:hypothetical protein
MPSSGMWRRVDLEWTDFSEERISSIFRVEKSASEELAWASGCSLLRLENSSTSTIHSWFGTFWLPSLPKDEKVPQSSALLLQWRCSKCSQEMVTWPGGTFCSVKDSTNWYIAVISV